MKEEQNVEYNETVCSTTYSAGNESNVLNVDFNDNPKKKSRSFRDWNPMAQYSVEMFILTLFAFPIFFLTLMQFSSEDLENVSRSMFSEALIFSIIYILIIIWGVCAWLLSETHSNIRALETMGNTIGFFDGSYKQIWLSLLSIPADAAIIMFCALTYRGCNNCRIFCFVLISAALLHVSQVLWDSIKAKRITESARRKIEDSFKKTIDARAGV